MKKSVFVLLAILAALSAGCQQEKPAEIPAQAVTVTEAPTEAPAETQPTETEAPGPGKVACVGDSITYGHGISHRSENSYPAVLGSLLGDGYEVENFGDPGSTVQHSGDQPYWEQERYTRSLEYEADIVVFMMGTNDSKEYNWHSEEAFREDLEAMLDSYGSSELYLCTPAKAYFVKGYTGNVTMFDIQPEVVDTIAEVVRDVARERGYPLIDIHALTAENPQWFSADGVHPDKAGAEAMAQAVYEALTGNS